MNKYYIFNDNYWNHKTPLKLFINPILRKIQFFTNKPFVITSLTEFINDTPNFLKYKLMRVKYYDSNITNICT